MQTRQSMSLWNLDSMFKQSQQTVHRLWFKINSTWISFFVSIAKNHSLPILIPPMRLLSAERKRECLVSKVCANIYLVAISSNTEDLWKKRKYFENIMTYYIFWNEYLKTILCWQLVRIWTVRHRSCSLFHYLVQLEPYVGNFTMLFPNKTQASDSSSCVWKLPTCC